MQVDVEVSRLLHAPREQVVAYAGDPERAPQWYANIVSARWVTPPPVRVGSAVAFTARFLGRTLVYTYEVVVLEPGSRLVMRTADGPFPMRTTYTWADEDGGTRMTLRNDGRPSGFAALAAPVLEAAMRRAMTKDLARLATLVESG